MPRPAVRRASPLSNYPFAVSLGEFLERLPKPVIVTAGFGSVGFIAVIDYWFNSLQIHFLVLYLVPIFFLTWFTGWTLGSTSAVFCSIVNFAIDFSQAGTFENPTGLYVSAVVALPMYLLTARIISAMRALVDHEQELARTDYTTGAANRRAFFEALEVEVYRARRHQLPLTVISIDLDNFKAVNDKFGHRVGDTLLEAAVDAMLSNTRVTDTVARLGGDEFALLLPEAGAEAALSATERLKNGLLEEMRHREWPVTLSIGIATFLDPPGSPDELMKKADDLMYDAKRAGKDTTRHQVY